MNPAIAGLFTMKRLGLSARAKTVVAILSETAGMLGFFFIFNLVVREGWRSGLDDPAGLVLSQILELAIGAMLVFVLTLAFCRTRPHIAYALWLALLVKPLVPPAWSYPIDFLNRMTAPLRQSLIPNGPMEDLIFEERREEMPVSSAKETANLQKQKGLGLVSPPMDGPHDRYHSRCGGRSL